MNVPAFSARHSNCGSLPESCQSVVCAAAGWDETPSSPDIPAARNTEAAALEREGPSVAKPQANGLAAKEHKERKDNFQFLCDLIGYDVKHVEE